MLALHGTAIHAERLVQGFRRAKEAEELSREARQHATRNLTWSYDQDGSMMIRARLPAETGALFLKALDAAAEEIPSSEVPSERVPAGTWAAGASAPSAANPSTPNAPEIVDAPTRAARRADALGVLAETFLKQGGHALNGGERYQIIVHVDAETFRNSTAGRCEMEDGPSLPAETVRRFACDSGVVMLLENENGEPLNVGRRTRSIPPAIRRALNVRDKGCRFPGCTHTRYVDAHHIHHWALGGETKTQNLVTLCRAHHRLVHEGSITIRHLDDGAFRFIRPNGKAFDSLPPQPTSDFSQLPLVNDGNGIAISRNTAVSLWRGERCDYGLGVEVLLRQSERGRNVPAGTRGALK